MNDADSHAERAEGLAHIDAAEDILDFLDRGGSGSSAAELTSAVKALTHATLALARFTQAGPQ